MAQMRVRQEASQCPIERRFVPVGLFLSPGFFGVEQNVVQVLLGTRGDE
jgi:hypothetical protein